MTSLWRDHRSKLLAAAIVLTCVGLGVVVARLVARPAATRTDDVRVLVALVTLQEDGSRAADVVAYARLRPEIGRTDVVLVPSTTRVAVPGITDDRLREVYAYGGAELLAEVFSERFRVPVDAAVAIDETRLAALVGQGQSLEVRLDREIDLFRQDRYRTFAAGVPVRLDATGAADLLAASALAEPPGQDMTLQAALVRALVPAVAARQGSLDPGSEGELHAPRRLIEQLPLLAARSGWPGARVVVADGAVAVEGERVYSEPDPVFWAGLAR